MRVRPDGQAPRALSMAPSPLRVTVDERPAAHDRPVVPGGPLAFDRAVLGAPDVRPLGGFPRDAAGSPA